MIALFEFDLSDDLKREMKKQNKSLSEALKKKIREIVSRDKETIDFYKNMRSPMNEFKRVHVGSSY